MCKWIQEVILCGSTVFSAQSAPKEAPLVYASLPFHFFVFFFAHFVSFDINVFLKMNHFLVFVFVFVFFFFWVATLK